MSASGFDEKYFFYGFLPKTEKQTQKVFEDIKEFNFNIVFFVPAIKINFYIKNFKKFFKERDIFIGREMTKIHETFYRGSLNKFNEFKTPIKGELTVILSKMKNMKIKEASFKKEDLKTEIKKYLKRYSLKDVVKLISVKNSLPRKKVYDLCLSIKKDE